MRDRKDKTERCCLELGVRIRSRTSKMGDYEREFISLREVGSHHSTAMRTRHWPPRQFRGRGNKHSQWGGVSVTEELRWTANACCDWPVRQFLNPVGPPARVLRQAWPRCCGQVQPILSVVVLMCLRYQSEGLRDKKRKKKKKNRAPSEPCMSFLGATFQGGSVVRKRKRNPTDLDETLVTRG